MEELNLKDEKNDIDLKLESIKEQLNAKIGADFENDLLDITLYKFPKETPYKNGEMLEKLENLDNFNIDSVGKKHGGGNFGLYVKIFNRNIGKDGSSVKKIEKWEKAYFILGENYNKYIRQNKLTEQIEDMSFISNMKNELLNKTHNGQNDINTILMTFKEQMENNQRLMLEQQKQNQDLMFRMMENKNSNNSSSLDLVGLLGVLVPLFQQNKTNDNSLVEKLLLMQMERNNNSQSDMLKYFEKGLEMKKMIEPEKNETMLDGILGFLPEIIPKLGELLSPKASIPVLRKKALEPYKGYIDEINNDPEIKIKMVEEMKKQGYSEREIEIISQRAGVNLNSNDSNEGKIIL